MSKQTEALKLALEALEMWCPMTATYLNTRDKAITALQEALAQPQQEPVAWMNAKRDMTYLYGPYNADDIPLYTSPPASKPWVGLTDAERETLRSEADEADAGYRELIKATEAKLRKKNS